MRDACTFLSRNPSALPTPPASAQDRRGPCILKCPTLRQEGTLSLEKSAGHGAANRVTYIRGNTDTKMLWPADSIPDGDFTVCSVTRYTGRARGKILTCKNSPAKSQNWFHGHWSRRGGCTVEFFGDKAGTCQTGRGRAKYGGWKTDNFRDARYQEGTDSWESNNHGAVDDWLVMCGTNGQGTDVPGNIVIDQEAIGTTKNGGSSNCQLNIGYHQASDWALHSLFIWNKALSTPRPLSCSLLSRSRSPSLSLPLSPPSPPFSLS